MTLDEALSAQWQKTGKTVEELLRNGSLTFSLLRDLANKADNEWDKKIARVIWLEYEQAYARVYPTRINQTWLMNLPGVSMSVEEAMSTPWKGRENAGVPMGRLQEQGLLSMRELGWAVEKNWDDRVKEAARILLYQRLETMVLEPRKTGVAKVIQAAASYSRERVEAIGTNSAIIWGFGGGGILVLLMQKFHMAGPNWLLWAIFIGALIWSMLSLFLHSKETQAHTQGADEEDRVAARLAASLDSSWTILRNVQKKGIKGDIDIVLVGPGGVYALEVKNWKTDLRIEGDRCYFSCNGKGKGGYGNPVKQAIGNAVALHDYLASKGVDLRVNPILVVAVNHLDLASPDIPVWKSEDVAQEAAGLPNGAKTAFDPARVVAVLEAGNK